MTIFKASKAILYFFLTLCSTILILCLPSLFTYNQKVSFQPFLYAFQIEDTVKALLHPGELTITIMDPEFPKELPLFPAVWKPYSYSLTLLACAFLAALILAVALAYVYMLVPRFMKDWMNRILFIWEAIPDLMVIVGLQMLLIWFFNETGWKPFRILNFREGQAYALPIICLSILPTVQLFRMLTLYLSDEQDKPYVELVRGKGFAFRYITAMHLFRNVFIHLFYHARTIFLFMLSNLFVLEYIFNMEGMMRFLFSYGAENSAVGVVVVILLFLPFYLIFSLGSLAIKRVGASGEEAVL